MLLIPLGTLKVSPFAISHLMGIGHPNHLVALKSQPLGA